jgi:hypothetical protein
MSPVVTRTAGGQRSVSLGLTAKRLQSHKSNDKAALLWLAKEKGMPRYGVFLAPAWEELRSQVGDSLVRSRLSFPVRFCSATGIEPTQVDEAACNSWSPREPR